MPLREPALLRIFGSCAVGEKVKKETPRHLLNWHCVKVFKAGLPVESRSMQVSTGFPFEGPGVILRRTKALTITERND